MKGIRWLILKRSENLDEGEESGSERDWLESALNLDTSLATAYYWKKNCQ